MSHGIQNARMQEDAHETLIAPPPPAVRAGGAGGLVLPGETAAHASETLAYSGICVRHANNSIRKGAFEGELSSGASVLRVSVQQFRAVLPSSSGAAPRAEHMARCSDHRGQGPRPGPVPRAPRGLLHPRAVEEGEEAENDSGGASIAPRARPRMRVAALPSHRIDPAGCAAVRPPHTRALASPPLPLPPLHRPAHAPTPHPPCSPARWAHELVSGSISSYRRGSCSCSR